MTMKIDNVISPAQARLNFCDADYVRVLTEVNEAIVEASRFKSEIKMSFKDVQGDSFVRAVNDLQKHGFQVLWHRDDGVSHITLRWGN